MSFTYANLLDDIPALAQAGVRSLRLSPHRCDMVAVTRIFYAVAHAECGTAEAASRLAAEMPSAQFSNGFLHGKPGWRQLQAAE